MTKSELIDRLSDVQQHLAHLDVELGVKSILEQMSSSLSNGERIEIRGFGSFSLHHRAPRMGRNPKTGEAVALPGKHVPHFKPGKSLDLLWVQFELPLGLAILLGFSLGVVLGLSTIYLVRVLPLRLQLRKTRAALDKQDASNLSLPDD